MAAQQNLSGIPILNTLHDDGAEDYIEQNLSSKDCESLLPNDNKLEHGNFNTKHFFTEHYIKKSPFQQPLHTKSFLTGRFEMSPVRRMFCLLVLFDCLMTFLMWIIYLQVTIILSLLCLYIYINCANFKNLEKKSVVPSISNYYL